MNAHGEWETGDTISEALLNNSTPITDVAVATAGWQITDHYFRRYGPLLLLNIRAVRTGTAMAAIDADLPNTSVCTLPTACRGSLTGLLPIGSAAFGANHSGYYVPATGIVYIASGPAVSNGETISLGGMVFVD